MPTSPPSNQSAVRSRRRLRLFVVSAITIFIITTVWVGVSLGRLLSTEDPLETADAIFVLGGRRLSRAAEAGELYLAGHAPRIVLSTEFPDEAENPLRPRGVRIPTAADLQIMALTQMGVPHDAIVVTDPQLSTGAEARTLRELAVAHGWHKVIVVTSVLHTTRAHYVFTRRLAGTHVRIIIRATRYDSTDVNRWWRNRSDLMFAINEAQKLVAYWSGWAD